MTPASVDAPGGAPIWKRFSSAAGEHLLVVPYSRLFDLPAELAASFDAGEHHALALAAALAQRGPDEDPLSLIPEPAPQSLSLNVSASCNLSCTYCYADRGSFGKAQTEPMTPEVARAAVDRLLAGARADRPVTVGFLGGEPFANAGLIHDVVRYASERARRDGFDLRFSVTTNGTLLRAADLDLLRSHPFAVTVSIDGGAAEHDGQRPMAGGGSSFHRLRRCLPPLLAEPGRAKVAARATVTRRNLDLRALFASLRRLGFAEIGFAPLRATRGSHADALTAEDWPVYLDGLLALARDELGTTPPGTPLRLTNLAVALKQIRAGASSPYPCGAGGGYFSVSVDGRWYACHRAVGDRTFDLGDNRGLDAERRRAFLRDRHVHAKSDCGACWARYLCAGGCHQEAETRSSASCDFVRSWLEFCLVAVCEEVPAPDGSDGGHSS